MAKKADEVQTCWWLIFSKANVHLIARVDKLTELILWLVPLRSFRIDRVSRMVQNWTDGALSTCRWEKKINQNAFWPYMSVLRPNPHWTRSRKCKQMEPAAVNWGVHTAHKQHQRICAWIGVGPLASNVDWTLLCWALVLSSHFLLRFERQKLTGSQVKSPFVCCNCCCNNVFHRESLRTELAYWGATSWKIHQ